MRLTPIATAVALTATSLLTACGGSDSNAVVGETITAGVAKVQYNPMASQVSTPNNLLFNGSLDGTINLPDEAAITDVGEYTGLTVVQGALDGWQTTVPIAIPLVYDAEDRAYEEGVDPAINADSLIAGVKLYQVRASGFADDCADVSGTFAAGQTCEVVAELVYGTDFVASFSSSNIVVVPLKPLMHATSYMVALTADISDVDGNPLAPSDAYQLLGTAPAAEDDPTLQQLKGLTNWDQALLAAEGVANPVYSAVFTTQSLGGTLAAMQQVYGGLALNSMLNMSSLVDTTMTAANVADAYLGGSQPSMAISKLYQSTLSVPYFLSDLDEPDLTGADVSKWAQAMSDSPVAVLQLLDPTSSFHNEDFANQASLTSFWAQATAAGFDVATFGGLLSGGDTTGAAQMLAASGLKGLTYQMNGEAMPVDMARHLTAYNPVPEIQSYAELSLDVYLPDTTLTGLTMPADGWPVVIYQHGIATLKETAAAIAPAYNSQGFALVALNLPYHGDRGFDFNADGVYEISASENFSAAPQFANANSQVFANLASFLSIRSNVNQSSGDILAVRAALSAAGAPAELDGANVHMAGQSLGSIVSVPALALSGSVPIQAAGGLPVDFSFNSASLSVPGGGLAGVFFYSGSFGPVVEAGLKSNPAYLGAIAAGLGFVDTADATALEQFEDYRQDFPGLVQLIIDSQYPGFANLFVSVAQTVVDGIDPLAYAAQASSVPTLIHEVVGDGADNQSDQTIPNNVAGAPLVGTDPLIVAYGVDVATQTAPGSYAVRYNQGSHGSLIDPSASLAATTEMQTQFVSYAASAQAGMATLVVTDNTVVTD